MSESSTPSTLEWGKIGRDVLVALFTMLVPVITLAFQHGCFQSSSKPSQTTSVFQGIVRQATDHTPISGAHVQVAVDGRIAVIQVSDSEGMFHVDVPAEAKTLHLIVGADGFSFLDRDADPQRTTPEILELRRSLSDAEHLPHTDKTVIKPRSASSSPKPDTATKPSDSSTGGGTSKENVPVVIPQAVCASGVLNCNLAPNGGDQSIHINEPKPPPNATMSQYPLQPTPVRGLDAPYNPTFNDEDPRLRGFPGVDLRIYVDRIFENPAFVINCDQPCQPSLESLGRRIGDLFDERDIRVVADQATNDMKSHRLTFEDKLSPRSYIMIRFRSLSATSLRITSLKSVEEN